MQGKVRPLENKTQWLENWMREVEAKVKQLDAAWSAAKDTTDPSSRAKAASPELGEGFQGQASWTTQEGEEYHAATVLGIIHIKFRREVYSMFLKQVFFQK